ncbi:MAG: hypothetical protein ACREFC_09955 [Stellaceae bacterium]
MGTVIGLIDDVLAGAMAIAGGVTHALGQTGSIILVLTATIGLVWIAGRTLKL